MNPAVGCALVAALLFGASTPLAKWLLGSVPPLLLSSLLYLGSGVGLLLIRVLRDGRWRPSGLKRDEWPWLLGAIGLGGVWGPVALLMGLQQTSGSTASLLLNLEAVLTALLAWVVFKENAGRRVVFGMVAMVVGGLLLSWPAPGHAEGAGGTRGPLLIVFACLCWAIDNNFTRKVSASDALFIAGAKGLAAGVVNGWLAWMTGAEWPVWSTTLLAMTVGLLGYGVSLVCFVLALRGLGTARTGAYFAAAPFAGALLSLWWLGESVGWAFWVAGGLMAGGVWLHLTEGHEHAHTHEPLTHSHAHRHDEHHQHAHAFAWNGVEPHVHLHHHTALTHQHPHVPDIHHRHTH